MNYGSYSQNPSYGKPTKPPKVQLNSPMFGASSITINQPEMQSGTPNQILINNNFINIHHHNPDVVTIKPNFYYRRGYQKRSHGVTVSPTKREGPSFPSISITHQGKEEVVQTLMSSRTNENGPPSGRESGAISARGTSADGYQNNKRIKGTLSEIEQSIELAWPNYGQMLNKNVSRKSSERGRNQSFMNKSVDRSQFSNTGYDLKIETSAIIDSRKASPGPQSKNLKLKSGTINSKDDAIPKPQPAANNNVFIKPSYPQKPGSRGNVNSSKSPLRQTRQHKPNIRSQRKVAARSTHTDKFSQYSDSIVPASSSKYTKNLKESMAFMQESRDPKYQHVKDMVEVQAHEIFKNLDQQLSPKNSQKAIKGISRSTSPADLREPFFVVLPKPKNESFQESFNKGNQSITSKQKNANPKTVISQPAHKRGGSMITSETQSKLQHNVEYPELLTEANKTKRPFVELERRPHHSVTQQQQFDYIPASKSSFTNPNVYFTQKGFIEMSNQPPKQEKPDNLISARSQTEIIRNEIYLSGNTRFKMLLQLPFFRCFRAYKLLILWNRYTRRINFERNRLQLKEKALIAQSVFLPNLIQLNYLSQRLEGVNMFIIKEKHVYSSSENGSLSRLQERADVSFQASIGEISKSFVDLASKIHKDVEEDILNTNKTLEKKIENAISWQYAHGSQHYSTTLKEASFRQNKDDEMKKLRRLEPSMYRFIIVRICSALIATILKNEGRFASTLLKKKTAAAFQISLMISPSSHTTELIPSQQNLLDSLANILDNTRNKLIFQKDFTEAVDKIQKGIGKQAMMALSTIYEYVNRVTSQKSHEEKDVIKQAIQKVQTEYEGLINNSLKYNKFGKITKFYEGFKQKIALYEYDVPETTVLIGWLVSLGEFSKEIETIPINNIPCGDTMFLYCEKMKLHLLDIVSEVIEKLRDKAIDTVDRALGDFKYDLMYKAQSISTAPSSVEEYIEQIRSIENFHEKKMYFEEELRKFENALALMKDHKIKPTPSVIRLLEQIKLLMESLPASLENALDRIIKDRIEIVGKIKESYLEFVENIQDFRTRYINEYFRKQDRIERPELTLEELIGRSSNIENRVRKMVTVYMDFDYYESLMSIFSKKVISEEKERDLRAQLDSSEKIELPYDKTELKEMMEGIDYMHKECKKLWKMIVYWVHREKGFLGTPFKSLTIERVFKCGKKVQKYFSEPIFDPDDEDFGHHAKWIKVGLLEKITRTTKLASSYAFLQNDKIKPRHWQEILNLLKLPSMNFTFEELMETDYEAHLETLQKLVNSGESEVKYEEALTEIFEDWDAEKIRFIKYKRVFIADISDTEFLRLKLEDYKTVIEQIVARKGGSSYLGKKAETFVQDYDKIQKLLDLLIRCHNRYLNVELLEEELVEKKKGKVLTLIVETFGENEVSKINGIFEKFKHLLDELQACDPKLKALLLWKELENHCKRLNETLDEFEGMSLKMRMILDNKRESFPRYNLLDDRQLISFMNAMHIGEGYGRLLPEIFPGAYRFHISSSSSDQPQSPERKSKSSIDYDNRAQKPSSPSKDRVLQYLRQLQSQAEKAIPEIIHKHQSNYPHRSNISQKNPKIPPIGLTAITEEIAHAAQTKSDHSYIKEMPEFIREIRDKSYIELKVMSQATASSICDSKILGIIDRHNEYLLFKKPVLGKGRSLESVLKKIEFESQSSVNHWINQSITSFPHYSLDEWILDYPVQVVISAIHLIVTHEIYEMMKVLEKGKRVLKSEDPNNSEQSSNIYNTYDSASLKKSNKSPGKRNNKHTSSKKDAPKAGETAEQKKVREEIDQILAKPYVEVDNIEDPADLIELFGYNMDLKYISGNKEETHSLLQQKSFRGLYLRLQFWINLLMKNLRKDFANDDKSLYNHNYQLKCQKVISFIIFLKDMVLDLYENSSMTVSEFEWQKHIRLSFDSEGRGCIVECGGWSGLQGNEYLGSMSRHLITPITEKYFVFISAALREKSAVGFKTISGEENTSSIIEEFATLCSVAYKSFVIPRSASIELLSTLVLAAANGNFWLNLEHLHNLPFSSLKWLNKEIQLVQQRVILADLNHQVDLSPNVKLTTTQMTQNTQIAEDMQNAEEEALRKRRRIPYGIFASYNLLDNKNSSQWIDGLKSAYRVTSLITQSSEDVLQKIAFVLGFRSHLILTAKIIEASNKFASRMQGLKKEPVTFITRTEGNDQQIISLELTLTDMKEVLRTASEQLKARVLEDDLAAIYNPNKPKGDKALLQRFNSNDDMDLFERAAVIQTLYDVLWDRVSRWNQLNDENHRVSKNELKTSLEQVLTNVFRLASDKTGLQDRIISQSMSNEQAIMTLFQRRGVIPNAQHIQNVLSLEQGLKHHPAVILLGGSYNGKTLCLDIFLQSQEKKLQSQGTHLRTLKLNPSIMNIFNKDYYIPEMIRDIFVEDNLEFILRRIVQSNGLRVQHYLIFDGGLENDLWDLLSNLVAQRNLNCSKEFDFDTKGESRDSYHTQFSSNILDINGRVYHFEKNITPIIETDSLSNLAPSSLPLFSIVNFENIIKNEEMLEILALKFFNDNPKAFKISTHQTVKETIQTYLLKFIETISSELFSNKKGQKFDLKNFLLNLFHGMQSLQNMGKKPAGANNISGSDASVSLRSANASENQSGELGRQSIESNKVKLRHRSLVANPIAGSIQARHNSVVKPQPQIQQQLSSELNQGMDEKPPSNSQAAIDSTTTANTKLELETRATISLIWTFGTLLDKSERNRFVFLLDKHLQTRFAKNPHLQEKFSKISIAEIFDYYYDSEKENFVKYIDSASIYAQQLNKFPCYLSCDYSYFVPTVRNFELINQWSLASRGNFDFIIFSNRFGGKTTSLWFLEKWIKDASSKEPFYPIRLHTPQKSDIHLFYKKIMQHFVEGKSGNYHLSESNKVPLIMVDDVSLRNPGFAADVDMPNFLRFWKKNRGIYSVLTNKFYPLGPINFVATVREPLGEGKPEEENKNANRALYESQKYNLKIFEEMSSLESIYKGILGQHENPKLVMRAREKIYRLLIDLVKDRQKQTGLNLNLISEISCRAVQLMKGLIWMLENTDFVNDEKDNLLAGAMLEELTCGPQRLSESNDEWVKLATKTILSHFKIESEDKLKSFKLVPPALRFELPFSKGVEINTVSVHQTIKKSIQKVPTKLLHSLCNEDLGSTQVYEQIWTLHRLLNSPHSQWLVMGSDHSYAIDFLETVAKLSPTKVIFDLLEETQNLSQLSERITKEYLELLKSKTSSLVFVFTQTETASGNFLDYFIRNFRSLSDLPSEFETALIDTFIAQLSVSSKYKYLKAKSSSELDRDMILDEAKKTISRKIRICVLITDHFSYEQFVKGNSTSFSHWPKFFLESWNQSTCLSLSQNVLRSEQSSSILSSESKAKLILNLCSELKEEYHRIFYSQRGLVMLSKTSTQQQNERVDRPLQKNGAEILLNSWNALALDDKGDQDPFMCFRDRLNHSLPVEDSYFSNEKFIILHKVYARLHEKVEKSLKLALDEVNLTLKQFQDVWSQYQKTTNHKNKSLVRDTEIQLKIHDLTRAIEDREQIIASKKSSIYLKQKEITQFEFQMERINYNLSIFGGQIAEFTQRLIKKLEKVPESQFELFVQEINLKEKKSKLFPIVETLCASLLGKLQIFIEFDAEAQKSLLVVISAKYEFLRLIGKYMSVSHETFGLLDYKSTNKLERQVAKLAELKDAEQTPFVKILVDWCNYYYKQNLYLQELRLLEEKMRHRKSEMQNSFDFVQNFSESIKNLESEIGDMKKKIDLLSEEHRSLKVNLEKSELGQSRIELLINSLKVIENKYQNKKSKYAKILETLPYDLIVIAMDLVLLGNLSNIHKFEVVSRLLAKNEFTSNQNSIKFSKEWTFDELFLEKSYKRILKVIGADNLVNAVWSSKFVNSYSRLNLYEYLLNQYLFWGFHETSKPGLFSPCLYSNLGCDLATLSELVLTEKEDSQLVTLTINYHYQQPIDVDTENTLAITALKKLDRRAKNDQLAAELMEYNKFLSTHVLCSLNNKNTEEDWIDLKLVLMKVFKQGDIDKVQEYQDLYVASKVKLALSKQKIDKLLSRPEKNFSLKSVFDAYETELRSYEEIQDFSKELYTMRENLLHEYPIMSTYCNILCLLYHSLFQFGNLAGVSVYSWFQYVRVCEAISRKILRDITNKQKTQAKNAQSAGNKAAHNQEEAKGNQQKSPRVTAMSKPGQGKKNKEILVANELGDERSKVSIKTAEGEDNSFYPTAQRQKEKEAVQRKSKNQSNKMLEEFVRQKHHKSKEESKQEKDESLDVEITIDEHFFFSYLVPSIWSAITSSINHDLVPLFTLVFAFNVGLKKGSLNENEFALFIKYFTEIKNYKRWKSDSFLNEEETSILSKETLEGLEAIIKEFVGADFQELFKVLKEKQKNLETKDLMLNKFLHKALRDEFKEGNLIQKLILSLFANKADVKSRLLQFIHQELPSIFDYQEDALRIHSFIKTATWHIPVAIFSAPSINTINTFCSIGSYYEVELEVVQLNSDLGEEERTTALSKIQSAALTGSWIVIHSKHLIDFWRDVVLMLQTFREENKVVNSFRLIFDFQELTEKDIDPQFLYEECVIYYLNEHNMEDMEGYNDVWANILNQNLIDFNDKSVFRMEMSQGVNDSLNPSKLVDNLVSIEHSKEFGLDYDDAKTIATDHNPMMILDEFDYKYMPDMQGMSRIQSNLSIGLGKEDSQMYDQLFKGQTDSAKK